MKYIRLILFLLIFIHIKIFPTVDITIDSSKKYQTIEGLGTAIAIHMLKLHNDPELINKLASDLGMSMLRLYPSPSFEPENDNDDHTEFDWSNYDFIGKTDEGEIVKLQHDIIKEFYKTSDPKIILSVFTPPAWMKDSGSEIGGKLRSDMYNEFAEYYSAYIKGIKGSTGVDVYAISPQNEPRWEQWYASCVYTCPEMNEVLKVLGNRMKTDRLGVKLFSAEDLMGGDWIPWTQPWREYFNELVSDSSALFSCDIIAVHTYEDGVKPSSPSIPLWNELRTQSQKYNKSVWMTETSGYDDSWDNEKGGLQLGQAIFAALRYGNCSAWVWLNAAMHREFNPHEGLVIYEENGSLSFPPKYYAAKQFFKYIRPGAIRISAVSSDQDINVVAFMNPAHDKSTIVIINSGDESKDLTIKNFDVDNSLAFRTSENEKCIEIMVENNLINSPGKSITTIYSDNITSVNNNPQKFNGMELQQNYPNPFNPSTTVKYSLNQQSRINITIYNSLGEQVKTLVANDQSKGIYSIEWDGTNDSGIRQGSGLYLCRLLSSSNAKVLKMMLLN
jgi:glucuronoarabinoxylan endo-1,4-beta-xylanase